MNKANLIITLLLTIVVAANARSWQQKFERSAFYKAMASGKVDDVDEQLTLAGNTPGHEAYEGVLLMRKAGLVGRPKDKLKYFKAGRLKFQTAFAADSNNTEYRFLRLAIQEKAPKIVKYHSNINDDKQFIIAHYKTLPPVVQQAVTEYSKTSKVLHPADL
ncbi:hypothetical protein [Mucilaginibacter ginkgonis]|uniref:Uncharacterized protein n=1 Tax=Mucilaginibacter ginkgonis TaxID=2682091 RepID=A0A6I4HY32_9SPHI|nr:hypothetical protein [Mucilaginibacter ginkgonis]QQL49398.1 hypothetical protein GO620_014670 [Mucilaginibacter ginkgonis]